MLTFSSQHYLYLEMLPRKGDPSWEVVEGEDGGGSKVKHQKKISGREIMTVNVLNYPGHKICKTVTLKQSVQDISSALVCNNCTISM